MPRWLIVVLSLLTMAGALGFLFFRDALMLRLADARTERLGLWVYDPCAAPGEAVDMEVGIYGGLKAGIDSIEARMGDQRVPVRGHGADWGSTISSRAGSSGHDSEEFQLRLPETARPGESLLIEVRVDYVLAKSTSYGSFSNRRGSDQVFASLVVRDAAGRFWGRLLYGGLALGAVVLFTLLCLWLTRLFARYEQDAQAGETLGVGLVIGLILMGYLGYWFFALPLVRATGLSADWFVIVLVMLWSLGPPVLTWRLQRGRKGQTRYRLLKALPVDLPAEPERWLAMLRDDGLEAERFGQRIRARVTDSPERVTLRLPKQPGFGYEQVEIRADGTRPVLAAAQALAHALGPLRLQVGDLVIDVPRLGSLAELEQAYTQRVMEATQEILAAMERAKRLFEKFEDGAGK